MFADMQSGDSVIIKAQVSKSANRIPRNLRNLGNPQLSQHLGLTMPQSTDVLYVNEGWGGKGPAG